MKSQQHRLEYTEASDLLLEEVLNDEVMMEVLGDFIPKMWQELLPSVPNGDHALLAIPTAEMLNSLIDSKLEMLRDLPGLSLTADKLERTAVSASLLIVSDALLKHHLTQYRPMADSPTFEIVDKRRSKLPQTTPAATPPPGPLQSPPPRGTSVGWWDSIFGERVNLEIPLANGGTKRVRVTRKWMLLMEKQGRLRKSEKQAISAHTLSKEQDRQTGEVKVVERKETWVIGEDIDAEVYDHFKDPKTGRVFALITYDEEGKQVICLPKEMWLQCSLKKESDRTRITKG